MKKAVTMFVLLLLCSSLFAVAQETDKTVEECTLGCKIWQFLFGSKEARAGRAWFDRSEVLVGEATVQEKAEASDLYKQGLEELNKNRYDEALIKFREADKVYPHYNNKHAIADTLQKSNRNDEALVAWQAYLNSNPSPDKNSDKIAYAQQRIKEIPTWSSETDSIFHTPGTVYKNAKGEYFITNDEGVGKEATEAVALQKLQENVASAGKPSIDSKTKSQLETALGDNYQTFEKSVGKVKSVYERPGVGVYVISGSSGEIIVDKEANKEGVRTAKRFSNDKIVERYVVVNGQIVATQKEADGVVKVGDSSYTLPKGKILTNADTLAELKGGIQLPGEEGEPSGFLQLTEGELTAFNYEEESFQRITKTETETGKIDYYREGVSGCTTKGGCRVLTGGEITFVDAAGNTRNYLVDYEFNTPFGADRELEQKEFFDPQTGRKDGIELGDGTRITRITTEKGKTEQGEQIYLVAAKDGTTIEAKKVNDNWVPVSSPISPKLGAAQKNAELLTHKFQETKALTVAAKNKLDQAKTSEQEALSVLEIARLQQASPSEITKLETEFKNAQAARNTVENELGEAKANEKEVGNELTAAQGEVSKEEQAAKEAEDELRNTLNEDETKEALDELDTEEGLATARTVLDSIYKITNNLKSYPAISNLLFQDADFYKDWRSSMDQAFAPLLASEWFPSAICDIGENRWTDIETEPGKAVIKTVSGTYQAVASIQMERSPESSPILCHKNPDEESDELFICDSRQVCVDNNFCYADQDRDNEPDSNQPLKGYFYKITWAVSSPQDEALTPLRDENGVAVSFNIFLYPGTVPMYNLNGNIASPIQLQNGASDKDAIIKYSTNLYDQACIRWNQAPRTITVPGGEEVEDVCFPVVTSSVGQVNWERSGQEATSVTVSHGQLSRNTDW